MALKEAEQGYVYPSLYHLQLSRFLERFASDRILVIDQRALREERATTLRQVFSFLGVQEDFTSPRFERSAHQTAGKRRPTRLGHLAYRIPGVHPLRDVLPWPFTMPLEKPELDRETRAWLVARLGPDVEALRSESGLPLEGWLQG